MMKMNVLSPKPDVEMEQSKKRKEKNVMEKSSVMIAVR